jgi:hypothetical protein
MLAARPGLAYVHAQRADVVVGAIRAAVARI